MWRDSYLIGFVVVLWIVFRDFGLLIVAEVSNEVIHTKILPPFLTVDEPFFERDILAGKSLDAVIGGLPT